MEWLVQDFSLHNHSSLSDGFDSILDIAQFAENIGLKTVGISDHFYRIENRLPEYIESIHNAQDKVKIKILIGAEVDVPDEKEISALEHIKKQYGFDFFIGAVHGIREKNLYVGDQNEITQSLEFHKKYWQLVTQLASGMFDIIAHIDIVKISGVNYEQIVNEYIERALELFKNTNQIIEVNTKDPMNVCPSDYILSKIIEKKIPLILSSDSHSKSNLCSNFDREYNRILTKFDNAKIIDKSTDIIQYLQTRKLKEQP